MQTVAQGNALEWEGGSIDDLVQMLATPALAVRVEVRTPSAGKPRKVGEIHMVAGGVYEALAGELRGDDAMEHLRDVSPLSFRLQPRLPNPDDGGLLIPGPSEGTLAERPPAQLMRYCELYVLTCALEIWRDTDRATIGYDKGEIVTTIVNGAEATDRLSEVINWDSGGYRIVLAELTLPEPPKAAPKSQGVGSKTMFGYPGVTHAPVPSVSVQTTSARATQVMASPVGELPSAPTSTKHFPAAEPTAPVVQASAQISGPIAQVAAPAPQAPAPAVQTSTPVVQTSAPVVQAPAPSVAAMEERQAPAPKVITRDTTPAVDPVLARAAATKEPAELVPSPDKSKADKKAESRKPDNRKAENRKSENRKAEARRTKGRPTEKSVEQPMVASTSEPSLLPSLGLGLIVGLALAAIYWIYRMLSGA